VPDRRELVAEVRSRLGGVIPTIERAIERLDDEIRRLVDEAEARTDKAVKMAEDELSALRRLLGQFDPQLVLKKGYSLVRGHVAAGAMIEIERYKDTITAEVRDVRKK